MDYWNHVLWSDETKINLFGSDGVKGMCGGNQVRSTKTSVYCLQSSMVVVVSWSGAAWVLSALGSYSSLREPWMPTCTVTYWPQTHLQDDHCLAKEAEGKCNLWGILKWKVEERKVSSNHQICDVVMEEWKRTPVATCEALVDSMPKRVKAVLENNGGHTKYWHFWPNLDIST